MEARKTNRGAVLLLGVLGVAGLVWITRPLRRPRRLQLPDDGHGPLIYRKYWIDICEARVPMDRLFEKITRDVPAFCPSLLADFTKTRGSEQVLQVGDEYDIRIFGPWNGRVRVVEVAGHQFTLATLTDHPEAGQIVFKLEGLGEGRMRFSISSQARSRDFWVNLAYRFLGGSQVQARAWQTFCERVLQESGGEADVPFQSKTTLLQGEAP